MQGNDMQMTLHIVKLGVVSSIYGYFAEETGWRCMYAQTSANWVYKGNSVQVLAYAWFNESENFL